MIYKNVNGTQKLVTNIRKPKKWRRFEYLQSSGTQYIDTGINPKVKPRVVAVLTMLNNADKDYWGNKAINGSAYYANFAMYQLYYYRYGSTTSQRVNYVVAQNTIHEWDVSDKVYVDGVLKFTSANTYTYNTSQGNIEIFKAGRSTTLGSTYRLHSFKLYDGDTLVRDFVPAQFNEEYGLWDLVQNRFYGNKGTGAFTVGPEVGKPYDEIEKILIPGEYSIPTGLDFYTYLQGDGQAYIDTECLLNRNCTISITMQLTEKVNQARYVGVQKSGLYILMYSGDSGNNIKTYTNISSGGTYGTLVAHNTVIHHYYLNDASHKSYCDGTSKVTHTSVPTTDNYVASCYLFWANGAAAGTQSTCKIYGCQIYDNDVLVRSLYPCTYKGQAGMWDKVNNVFYGNAGEGSFSLGDKINTNFEEVSDSMPLYDNNIHIEPDGSEWIHIFHHNNPTSNLFASTNTFLTQVHTDANRWFDVSYCYKLPKYEFLLKQSLTTGGTEYKYRWIQNISPMVAGFNDVPRSKVTYNEGTGYTVPGTTYGGLCRGIGSTYLRANNNAASNWWGAIGAWGLSSGYIPSWNGQQVTTGYIDLYVRKISIKREIPIWVQKNALIKSSSNGTYDYIDTGINNYTMNNIRCVCEMTPLNEEDTAFFGSRGSYYLFYKVSDNYFWPTSKCETIQETLVVGHKYLVDWNKGTLTVTGDDGVYQKGVRSSTTNNTQNLYIFTFNPKDARTAEAKIYWFKIYINDVLVRDFVPATMGGRPGLYDKVNHKMYFNANSSGNFTVE